MKLSMMTISAGLVLAAASAQAQSPSAGPPEAPRYTAISDLSGPYAEMPPPARAGYAYDPEAPGPRLLPANEVYTVLRDHGLLPLGTPRQRGFFYTIPVTDRRGDDGRLVIDARDGRIVRFVPAYRFGPRRYGDGPDVAYGPPARMPPGGPAPRPDELRPPAPVPAPKMASRTPSAAPLAKTEPAHRSETKPEVKPLAEKPAPAPAQQSAANQAKPAEAAPAPASPPPASVEAKPSAPSEPQILPTQEMPKVQGFE